MSAPRYLKDVPVAEAGSRTREPVDADTLVAAAELVREVREGGEKALRRLAERFDGLAPGAPLIYRRAELEAARDRLPAETRALLGRTAARIERFARAQRETMRDMDVALEGGRMGHRVVAVDRAGCYAPGGRYPYPSTTLMTTVAARVAGVREVWVASPAPGDVILGAAALGGADYVLAAGGAHAVAALAYGAGGVPSCEAVVGPGNRWVTAGKQLVAGLVRIDGLAGPSELTVLADESANAARVAADLIAQAEHDPDAYPALITTHADLVIAVRDELDRQLEALGTAEVARQSLEQGHAIVVDSLAEGAALCEVMAPEHLELIVKDPEAVASRLSCYGTLFIGDGAAEVFGDYGAGPNHTLPTGGMARAFSGLSVATFLKFPTFLRSDEPSLDRQLVEDSIALAELEGLEGHAAAARARLA